MNIGHVCRQQQHKNNTFHVCTGLADHCSAGGLFCFFVRLSVVVAVAVAAAAGAVVVVVVVVVVVAVVVAPVSLFVCPGWEALKANDLYDQLPNRTLLLSLLLFLYFLFCCCCCRRSCSLREFCLPSGSG